MVQFVAVDLPMLAMFGLKTANQEFISRRREGFRVSAETSFYKEREICVDQEKCFIFVRDHELFDEFQFSLFIQRKYLGGSPSRGFIY